MDAFHKENRITFLIEGGAPGADFLAYKWRIKRKVDGIRVFAQWHDIERPGAVVMVRPDGSKYDALAGFVRNQRMIDEFKPEFGVQFPGGNGTDDMRSRLDAARIPVYRIE